MSSTLKLSWKKISPHMLYWKCPTCVQTSSDVVAEKLPGAVDKKPIVLLLQWMNASNYAVAKYCGLYHNFGLDVISIKTDPIHFLWPSKAKTVTAEITDYLSNHQQGSPLIIHSFSIGAFLYATLIHEFLESPQKHAYIQKRICGQIFDSIVIGGLYKMANGVGIGVTDNSVLQRIIRGSLLSYFAMTKPYTVNYYNKYVQSFYNNPVQSPILMFYCRNDPMSAVSEVEKVAALWQERMNTKIMSKCWDKSVHTGHLKMHQGEYKETLQIFYEKVCRQIARKSKL